VVVVVVVVVTNVTDFIVCGSKLCFFFRRFESFGMLCHDDWQRVTDVSEECIVLILEGKQSEKNEGLIFLRNVGE
jgi:hypothetical protein